MADKGISLVNEGFRVSLIEDAFFDGIFEIPHIPTPSETIIPKGMVPFSIRERSEEYVDDLKRFPGIVSPDCSLYIDAPLCVQIAGIYLNRAVG